MKNYDSSAAQFLDIGAKRTVKDIADLQQKKDFTTLTGTVVRNIIKIAENTLDVYASKTTEQQILQVYEKLQQELKYAFELRQNTKVAKSVTLVVFTSAAYYYDVITKPDTEKANRLAEAKNVMITGITTEYNNPLIPMRDYIMTTPLNCRDNVNRALKIADYALTLYMSGVGRKRILLPKDYEIKHVVDIARV
jgi:hypothetical protein